MCSGELECTSNGLTRLRPLIGELIPNAVTRRKPMSTKVRFALRTGIKTFVVISALSLMLFAAAPQGWYLAGSKPAEYESGVDKQAQYNAHPSAYLRSKAAVSEGFGTLMQDF